MGKKGKSRETESERREFLRKTLVTSAYIAPTVITFSTKDVAKASPDYGAGGRFDKEMKKKKRKD